MILGGGDPTRLTLRGFLDAAAAIIVGEWQRLGVDLLTACEKVASLGVSDGDVPDDPVSASTNDQSMQMLMAQLAGVKGAPVR